jgi:hypothetical protein
MERHAQKSARADRLRNLRVLFGWRCLDVAKCDARDAGADAVEASAGDLAQPMEAKPDEGGPRARVDPSHSEDGFASGARGSATRVGTNCRKTGTADGAAAECLPISQMAQCREVSPPEGGEKCETLWLATRRWVRRVRTATWIGRAR